MYLENFSTSPCYSRKTFKAIHQQHIVLNKWLKARTNKNTSILTLILNATHHRNNNIFMNVKCEYWMETGKIKIKILAENNLNNVYVHQWINTWQSYKAPSLPSSKIICYWVWAWVDSCCNLLMYNTSRIYSSYIHDRN